MLSELSWNDYLTGMGLILALYYAIITLLCYPQQIRGLAARLKGKQGVNSGQPSDDPPGYLPDGTGPLMIDLGRILDSAGNKASKAQLLERFRGRLANFDGLRHPAFRSKLNDYLVKNARQVCGVGFSAQELEDEWQALLR